MGYRVALFAAWSAAWWLCSALPIPAGVLRLRLLYFVDVFILTLLRRLDDYNNTTIADYDLVVRNWFFSGSSAVAAVTLLGECFSVNVVRKLSNYFSRLLFTRAMSSAIVAITRAVIFWIGFMVVLYSRTSGGYRSSEEDEVSVTALANYVSILNIIDELGQKQRHNAMSTIGSSSDETWVVWVRSVFNYLSSWLLLDLGRSSRLEA